VLPYFLICVLAFSGLSILMIWYARFMFRKIYGDTRSEIDALVSGAPSLPRWDRRLLRGLGGCKTPEQREAVLARHRRYVEARLSGYIAFMKSTSLVPSEAAREETLGKLEALRRDYPALLEGWGTGERLGGGMAEDPACPPPGGQVGAGAKGGPK
jgi:hypothetical protein